MYFLNYVETFAFTLLALDAKNGRAKHFSAQTCIGLVASMVLSLFNVPKDKTKMLWKMLSLFFGITTGCICSHQVARNSDNDGSDDLSLPGMPKKMSKYIIYVAAFVMGLLALFVGCNFSVSGTAKFVSEDEQSTVCTFENFLHAFALLPQLVMSRRQGFVSPAAVRFLFIVGVKHIYEFSFDAYVSYRHYAKGKLRLHEFSFMSGDLIAALILLDFLYLVAVDKSKFLLCAGVKELELPDEEAIGVQQEKEITASSPFASILGGVKQRWADHAQRKKLLALVGLLALAGVGAALKIINVYAVGGAGVIFGLARWLNAPKIALPMHEKAEKCCV